jgi:hypothetical protein
MSAVFNALDQTPKQRGENNTVEYGWSLDIQEKIVQLSFQLVRTTDVNTKQNLMKEYAAILNTIFTVDNTHEKEKYQYGLVAYKLLAQTRDIIDGKGEYDLAYYMVMELAKCDSTSEQKLAAEALKLFVLPTEKTQHPYGSWKDIKYFLNFWKEQKMPLNHPIVNNCVRLVTEQLRKDMELLNPSLCARWIPRESSRKFGWQTSAYAKIYYSEWMSTVKKGDKKHYDKAKNKCLTHFRQDVLVPLNAKLKTPQVKQCGKEWSQINLEKDVTSVTMRKQRRAFQNVTKKGEVRSQDPDRVKCGKNFENLIERAKKGEATVKGKRVGVMELVKDMIALVGSSYRRQEPNNLEVDTLNLQWKDNGTQTCSLGNMVAMVDTSGSMSSQDAIYAALALGIRIAEKSKLGKRVMTFSASPDWVNLEKHENLSDMVAELYGRGGWGMNTNFEAALTLMLDACVANKVAASEVEKLILVILSDMQMDQGDHPNDTMYENMKKTFAEAGMRAVGEPYSVPHILFWNCRSTTGFPTLSEQPNASMMSGFSPALLNVFADKGMEALKESTPWGLLQTSLNKERYQPMVDAFDRYWDRRSKHVQEKYTPLLEDYDLLFDMEENPKKSCKCEYPREYAPHIANGPCRFCCKHEE